MVLFSCQDTGDIEWAVQLTEFILTIEGITGLTSSCKNYCRCCLLTEEMQESVHMEDSCQITFRQVSKLISSHDSIFMA